MDITGYIASYIFRMYMFDIVDVDSFLYTLGQNWQHLTFIKIYRHYILEWREYYIVDSNISVQICILALGNDAH